MGRQRYVTHDILPVVPVGARNARLATDYQGYRSSLDPLTRPTPPLSSHTHSNMAAGGQKDECDFYKALCTIRGTGGKTKGIACAVDIDGKKNKNEVVLVTWKGCNGEGKNSVKTVHRYSRNKKNPKDYQLEPSDGSILNRGNFSLIRCACGNDKWGVRLSPKYLKEEEQKGEFLVYTVDPDCYRSLTLKYHESTNVHRFDIKEEEEHIYANLMLRGAPIIQGEKYFVGVLTEDEEGKVSPLFMTGVFGE